MRRKRKGLVDERCMTCRFRGIFGSNIRTLGSTSCDYILIVGKSRGCPAGAKCKRYEPGDPQRRNIVITHADGTARGWWTR